MLHVEMSRITAEPPRLGDAIRYLASEARPAVEGQPGNLGTSLLIDPEAGVMRLESFWASDGALVASEDVIAASVREAARRALGLGPFDQRDGVAGPARAGHRPWRGHGGRGRRCGDAERRDRRLRRVPAEYSSARPA